MAFGALLEAAGGLVPLPSHCQGPEIVMSPAEVRLEHFHEFMRFHGELPFLWPGSYCVTQGFLTANLLSSAWWVLDLQACPTLPGSVVILLTWSIFITSLPQLYQSFSFCPWFLGGAQPSQHMRSELSRSSAAALSSAHLTASTLAMLEAGAWFAV